VNSAGSFCAASVSRGSWRSRCPPGRTPRRRRWGDDHFHLGFEQVVDHRGQALGVIVGRAPFDLEVFSFDMTQLGEGATELLEPRISIERDQAQHADAPEVYGRLRQRAEGEEARQGGQQAPAGDHRATGSASTSNASSARKPPDWWRQSFS